MSHDGLDKSSPQQDGPSTKGARHSVAPGKRPQTMSLPPATVGRPAPVQLQRDSTAGDRQEHAAITGHWMDVAMRPDLHAAPLQGKSAGEEHYPASALSSSGGGQPLPEGVRAKMESAFGADFSAVRVHEGTNAQAVGALAYTRGSDIHFAPGQYQPESRRGQELLGHELTHVVQQSQERVQATTQAKGLGINDDPALEREADEMGARAARGEQALARERAADAGGPGTVSRRSDDVPDAARRDMDEPLQMAGRASGKRAGGIPARGAVIQRSPISWLVKQLGKKAAVKAVKNYVKKNIKGKIKELTRERLKDHAKKFAQEADEIIGILDDPWWMTAIEMIPIVGDVVGGSRFVKQLDTVWDRIKSLERKIDAVRDKLRRIKLVEADNLDKFRTAPANLREQIAMKAAKSGEGRVAMQRLGDPRLEGMQVIKMEYTHTAADGKKTVIHYFRDTELGKDFAHKFKD